MKISQQRKFPNFMVRFPSLCARSCLVHVDTHGPSYVDENIVLIQELKDIRNHKKVRKEVAGMYKKSKV